MCNTKKVTVVVPCDSPPVPEGADFVGIAVHSRLMPDLDSAIVRWIDHGVTTSIMSAICILDNVTVVNMWSRADRMWLGWVDNTALDRPVTWVKERRS